MIGFARRIKKIDKRSSIDEDQSGNNCVVQLKVGKDNNHNN